MELARLRLTRQMVIPIAARAISVGVFYVAVQLTLSWDAERQPPDGGADIYLILLLLIAMAVVLGVWGACDGVRFSRKGLEKEFGIKCWVAAVALIAFSAPLFEKFWLLGSGWPESRGDLSNFFAASAIDLILVSPGLAGLFLAPTLWLFITGFNVAQRRKRPPCPELPAGHRPRD